MNTHNTERISGVLLDAPGYEKLAGVLGRAFHQAAHGKGAERHAMALPFDQQPMQRLIELYGVGFALGQAGKKAQEAQRLPRDRAVAELLGAINYLAGAVIAMERNPSPPGPANDNAKTCCGGDPYVCGPAACPGYKAARHG